MVNKIYLPLAQCQIPDNVLPHTSVRNIASFYSHFSDEEKYGARGKIRAKEARLMGWCEQGWKRSLEVHLLNLSENAFHPAMSKGFLKFISLSSPLNFWAAAGLWAAAALSIQGSLQMSCCTARVQTSRAPCLDQERNLHLPCSPNYSNLLCLWDAEMLVGSSREASLCSSTLLYQLCPLLLLSRGQAVPPWTRSTVIPLVSRPPLAALSAVECCLGSAGLWVWEAVGRKARGLPDVLATKWQKATALPVTVIQKWSGKFFPH